MVFIRRQSALMVSNRGGDWQKGLKQKKVPWDLFVFALTDAT